MKTPFITLLSPFSSSPWIRTRKNLYRNPHLTMIFSEVARDAKHLFDIVFKQVGRRKNSGHSSHVRSNNAHLEIIPSHSRQNSANLERVREDSNDSSGSQSSCHSSGIQRAAKIHVKKSTFFKYASKDWLRSQLKQEPVIPLNLYVNTQKATHRQHG